MFFRAGKKMTGAREVGGLNDGGSRRYLTCNRGRVSYDRTKETDDTGRQRLSDHMLISACDDGFGRLECRFLSSFESSQRPRTDPSRPFAWNHPATVLFFAW